MKQANFWMVFVGFESMTTANLKDMHKPTSPEINRQAARLLRQHGIGIIAGVIFGYPDDTQASITRDYRLMKKLRPDLIYSQYLTPYPKTRVRQELLDAGLVVNRDDYRTYDGFTCNIRTCALDQAALYRSLKWNSLKSYFDPTLTCRTISSGRILGPMSGPSAEPCSASSPWSCGATNRHKNWISDSLFQGIGRRF